MALRQLWHVFEDALASAGRFFGHPLKVENGTAAEVETTGRGCICDRFPRMFPPERVVFAAISEVYAVLLKWISRIKNPDHAPIKSLSHLNFINGNSGALKLDDPAVRHDGISAMRFSVLIHEHFERSAKPLEVLLPSNMPSRWAFRPRITVNAR